ncbi:hypothetical protein TYRP_016216 [Tyrophagus putrescentiae]|nr:hypothetical protein TYRP_016216 [Tyrophagus putrescentiae]
MSSHFLHRTWSPSRINIFRSLAKPLVGERYTLDEYRQKIENDFENIKQIFEEAELANPVDRYHVNSAPRNAVYALIDKSTIDTANGFRDLCVQIDQIGKDKSACSENVKKFNQIAIMRFLTSVFYFGSGEVNKDHHKHAVVGAGMTFGVIFNDNVQDLIKSFASSSAVATRIGRFMH